MSKASSRVYKFNREQCRTKFAYPDFLSALLACDRIRQQDVRKKGHENPLNVYECYQCGGIHIGHLGNEESILMYGGYSEDVRHLQSSAQTVATLKSEN